MATMKKVHAAAMITPSRTPLTVAQAITATFVDESEPWLLAAIATVAGEAVLSVTDEGAVLGRERKRGGGKVLLQWRMFTKTEWMTGCFKQATHLLPLLAILPPCQHTL